MLLVISGLPGTGKTTVARGIAERMPAVHLSIDPVEDALLASGLSRDWTTGVAAYEVVRAVAESNLALGWSVVVDAVNDSEAARDTWRRAATATSTDLTFVLLSPPDPPEHRRRLEGRERGLTHVREPTWDEVLARAADEEPWEGPCLVVDARNGVDQVVDRVLTLVTGPIPTRPATGRPPYRSRRR